MTVAVYFDLDHTLVTFDREFGAILAATLEESFGRVEDSWIDVVGEYFWGYFTAFDDDPYRKAIADLCDRERLDADPGTVAGRLIANELAATTVEPRVRDALERMAVDDDLRLGVLTNGVPPVQRGKLRRHDLAGYFDAVLVSYAVGAHKPDARIFEAARERIDADRYVMVGDDLEDDVVPAEEAGFEGVHVDENLASATCVRSLGDLDALARLL